MIRGLYTSAMGMIVQGKRQENISNNLANIETNSYKKQELVAQAFDRVFVKNKENSMGNSGLAPIGDIHLGVMIDEIYTDFQQGLLQETNKPLDLAIEGESFFTVQLENGDFAYTRDGSFKINANGQLSTKQGYLVMDENLNPIFVNNENIQVDGQGRINTSEGNTHSLNIINFPQDQMLYKLGENMYTIEGGQPLVGQGYLIRQGFVEKSNVNPLDEMVKMIEVTRSFESNQRAVQAMDETLGKAVNEVGRLG